MSTKIIIADAKLSPIKWAEDLDKLRDSFEPGVFTLGMDWGGKDGDITHSIIAMMGVPGGLMVIQPSTAREALHSAKQIEKTMQQLMRRYSRRMSFDFLARIKTCNMQLCRVHNRSRKRLARLKHSLTMVVMHQPMITIP